MTLHKDFLNLARERRPFNVQSPSTSFEVSILLEIAERRFQKMQAEFGVALQNIREGMGMMTEKDL